MEQNIKLFMPIKKNQDGSYIGVLSDTSLDRDNEMMSKSLINEFAGRGSIPMLMDHKNSMGTLIGAWNDLRTVEKSGHSALVGTPTFFSKDANPLASQVEKQVEEGLAMGLNVGISIGAIAKGFEDVEIDGKLFKSWTDAELLEASFVPIQSNRNSFAAISKIFNLDEETNMVKETIVKSEEKVAEPEAVVEQPVEEKAEDVSVEADVENEEESEVESKEDDASEVAEENESEDVEKKEIDIDALINKKVAEKISEFKKEFVKKDRKEVLSNLGRVEGPIDLKEVKEGVTTTADFAKLYGR